MIFLNQGSYLVKIFRTNPDRTDPYPFSVFVHFQNNIIKTDEQFYMLQKGLHLYFPKINNKKLNKLNFDISGKLTKFPSDINTIKENEVLSLNKDLLFIVETMNKNIVCLCLNKSYLPKKNFYLLFNENKIYNYNNKKINELVGENEFYRNETTFERYQYNKNFIKKIGDLINYFFEDFFGPIKILDSSKIKEIKLFEIISDI